VGEIVLALSILIGIILFFARLFSDPQPSRTYDVLAPGRALLGRFQRLGDMTGKTSADVIAMAGSPSSRSSIGNGQTLLQWQATGYHIAILFDSNGRFVRITHEYAHQ
jgi:hypothetical protein